LANDFSVLRGVDRAAFAVAFALRLRRAGIPVGLTAVEDFVRALAADPPDSLSKLYWTARISLVRRHTEIKAFDAVFNALFHDDPGPPAKAQRGTSASAPGDSFASLPETAADELDGGGLPWMTLPPAVADAGESAAELAVPERLPSEIEALADIPFEALDPLDMAMLGRWIESALTTWPTRPSRRYAVDQAGHRIALRPTVARARRTGWEPIHLIRVRPTRKPRRIVMVCDVSQSMQAQAVAYFHLMRAFTLRAEAEVFAFATRLTRLTPVLAHKSATVAIDEATSSVVDRFGGTRIASNLRALLASHHGNALRGAIVVIGSDGWDSDPPEELAAAMARLRRRAWRVVWMNPRAAAPGFEPRVASMAAAIPYIDDLLPADTFRSLVTVIDAIAR
jgi:uncharacterized protein with von Willebrand factor type A (vWA) domain